MRMILALAILTLMAGGVVGVIAAINLILNRGKSWTFLALANQFLCTGLAFVALLVSNEELPRPRPTGYVTWLLIALLLMGFGVWPAALCVLIVSRKQQNLDKE
jgi:hypothetical protein